MLQYRNNTEWRKVSSRNDTLVKVCGLRKEKKRKEMKIKRNESCLRKCPRGDCEFTRERPSPQMPLWPEVAAGERAARLPQQRTFSRDVAFSLFIPPPFLLSPSHSLPLYSKLRPLPFHLPSLSLLHSSPSPSPPRLPLRHTLLRLP